jgi:hypothetical protein
MSKWALFVVVVLFFAGNLYAQQPGATRPAGELPQIIAFDGDNFTGDHTHLVGDMKRLGKWENSISSMIILSGTWEFFDDDDFAGTSMAKLEPGMYPKVTDKGIKDNSISSIRLVSPAGR